MYCPLDDDALVMAVCRLSFMCDSGDYDAGRDVLYAFFYDVRDTGAGILDYELCIRGDNAGNAADLADALALVMECLEFRDDRALRWIDSVRARIRIN